MTGGRRKPTEILWYKKSRVTKISEDVDDHQMTLYQLLSHWQKCWNSDRKPSTCKNVFLPQNPNEGPERCRGLDGWTLKRQAWLDSHRRPQSAWPDPILGTDVWVWARVGWWNGRFGVSTGGFYQSDTQPLLQNRKRQGRALGSLVILYWLISQVWDHRGPRQYNSSGYNHEYVQGLPS
ncbi:uncharacterized protein B0I36DRAFT_430216 [Microdochium trichocladiopsis]|uniref:Uncharacterized protein n=1 Tax=Microdochium trichocladiopsis TaxID=1682393 RepID=A0A9P9BP74_9PEZI|nr:uncharacterized protein B0I36DRAFT_430216 [Microdochium trichocladiopsis]KAH7032844.1 hypothetical protein B0I36DRAFT_430216 [Microdochium trichocladiopsis]